jgi:hypothetical protein
LRAVNSALALTLKAEALDPGPGEEDDYDYSEEQPLDPPDPLDRHPRLWPITPGLQELYDLEDVPFQEEDVLYKAAVEALRRRRQTLRRRLRWAALGALWMPVWHQIRC